MSLSTILYRITNAEPEDRRATAKKDDDPVLIVTGEVSTSRDGGKTYETRKTPRLVITREMRAREGFKHSHDAKSRVIQITLPTEKRGRKRKIGLSYDFLADF